MKIALYSENLLKNSGGAEVYALLLGMALKAEHEICFFSLYDKNKCMYEICRKYGLEEMPNSVIYSKRYKNSVLSILESFRIRFLLKRRIQKRFDLFINCSSNKMPGIKGIYSIHLIHFPARNYKKNLPIFFSSILDNQYRNSYQSYLVNSNFTNYYLYEYWGVKGILLYPPINMECILEEDIKGKENIILAVGRLVPDKKMSDLVQVYKKMSVTGEISNYKFVIIGNTDSNYLDYYKTLQQEIQGYNIEIKSDLNYSELVAYYKKAKIFWHARGYQAENEDPFYMEHFGMTTVEAMANGCVPIVINKAGQKEIIENAKVGYLWNDLDELEDYTKVVVNTKNLIPIQMKVVSASKKYLLESFNRNALKIIGDKESL